MSNIKPIQYGFSAGEISPLMYGHTETEGYKNGLRRLRNMIPDARGPAKSRSGLRWVSRGTGNDGRVENIQITESEAYIVLFSDLRLEINTSQGAVPGTNLITNANFTDSGTGWTVVESTGSTVSFSPSDCQISPYQPSDSMMLNPDFALNGLGWIVRVSHIASTVTFAGGICTMAPRDLPGEFAGIAQDVPTSFPGEVHTVTIVREPGCGQMTLSIGLLEGGNGELDQVVPAGSGPISYTFTPIGGQFWVTLDTPGSGFGNIGIISSMDVAEPVTGHTASIAQGVVTAEVGIPHYVGAQFSIEDGQTVSVSVGTSEGDGTYFDGKVGVNNWAINITPTVADIWIMIEADSQEVDPSVSVRLVIIAEPDPVGDDDVVFDTPWTEDQLPELQFVPTPAAGSVYILHRSHPPYKLSYNLITKAWALIEVTFTSKPVVWALNDHPSTGTVFQGRLWLGGPKEAFWGSKSADFEDFTIGSLPDDALEFTLEKYGAIRWMVGFKNLLIGTENGEHIAAPTGNTTTIADSGDVLAPGNIQVNQQSSYGSAPLDALQVGDQVFYVSPDRRKIRAMQYQWTENNWLSNDLTFVSEHLTQGLIKSMCWVQNPDNLFLAVLHNGDAASLSYNRANNIYGWSLFESQAKFLDMTSPSYFGFSEIVSITQHDADTLDLGILSAEEADVFMDVWQSVYSETPTTTFIGYDHLNNQIVQVLADGAVHPDVLVVNGVIELQLEANRCTAGFGFTSYMETLPADFGSPEGSGAAMTKRWNEILVRVRDSSRPIVNGVRAPARTPSTPMDEREPVRNEVVYTFNLGADLDATIRIEEPLPLPITILSIFGDMEQDSL